MFVNATIVHHNHGVRQRKGLHMVQSAFNKSVEGISVESTLEDVAVQHTLCKREGRENRESVHGVRCMYRELEQNWAHLRPRQKKAFLVAF